MTFLRLINVQGYVGIAVGAILGLLLFLQTQQTHSVEHKLTDTQTSLVAAQKTIINYQQAAEKARQADAANVARVQREQAAINERTKSDYEARLADARARADSLRSRLEAAAHSVSRGTAGVSGSPGSAHGTPDATAEDGFSLDDRLTATEQAIQLDELIKWVRRNLDIDYNGDANGTP